ncbi:MAG: hypothetical protein M1833_001428 [Piccolia ochrophora]|nr:MAG: hypothetical protein M1833_001428 [Piccolia ochrophora]
MATSVRNLLRHAPRSKLLYACPRCRHFTTSSEWWSGHNRWSKIKHDKGKNDARREKQRSALARELTQASQIFGADPRFNPRLESAITNAKQGGFPKASIESAIARGQGRTATGASLEPLTIEAMLPPSIAVVIECQTDGKARAMQDLRLIVKEHGGTATPTTYLFKKRGRIVFKNSNRSLSSDDVLEVAAEAGAEDVETDEDGNIVVYTEPSDTRSTTSALGQTLALEVASSDIVWDPNEDTMVDLTTEESAKALDGFLEELEAHPSVQDVYTNVV